MNIINTLSKYTEFSKELFQWYKSSEYVTKIPLNVFLGLPEIMILPIIEEFIAVKHNIGINYDIGCVILYYFEPELNVNEIIALSKARKEFTYTILEKFDLIKLDYVNSYKRAIIQTLEHINEPF